MMEKRPSNHKRQGMGTELVVEGNGGGDDRCVYDKLKQRRRCGQYPDPGLLWAGGGGREGK